jgi:hypothetical protein
MVRVLWFFDILCLLALNPMLTLFHLFFAADEVSQPGYPLAECQGDCDSDDECAGDLICCHRDGTEVVPGCVGVAAEKKDYCVKGPQQLVAVVRKDAGSFP